MPGSASLSVSLGMSEGTARLARMLLTIRENGRSENWLVHVENMYFVHLQLSARRSCAPLTPECQAWTLLGLAGASSAIGACTLRIYISFIYRCRDLVAPHARLSGVDAVGLKAGDLSREAETHGAWTTLAATWLHGPRRRFQR